MLKEHMKGIIDMKIDEERNGHHLEFSGKMEY